MNPQPVGRVGSPSAFDLSEVTGCRPVPRRAGSWSQCAISESSRFSRTGAPGHRGFALVAVLVVVMLASMIAISLLFRMKAEETAAAAGAGSEQAWAAAMSGVHEAMKAVAGLPTGNLDWRDSPATFRERFVSDDGSDRWFFTVFTRGDPDGEEIRYGLTDEASKLNVNTATEEMLGRLPGLKPLLTEALLDFIDPDNEPHPEGAEQEYYDALPQPYKILNGPCSTLDELLLVRGFTASVLYGEDANLNFHLDTNENDSDENFPSDDGDSRLNPGLRPFLTVASYEWNEDSEGLPRTDLNDPEDPPFTNGLPATVGPFIDACRSNKVVFAHAADLLEATTQVKNAQGKPVELASGVGKDDLATVLDWFTATNAFELMGLINVNTASATVLQTVPGIDETLAGNITSLRRTLGAEKMTTTAWLYNEGVMDAEKFKELAPYLTARSHQFSFHVVGYGVPSGRYRVLEVIIDNAGGKPVILYLRDLTRLGLPFRIESEQSFETAGRGGAGGKS